MPNPPRARSRARETTLAALLAALLAASAWVTVPVGAVPVTLQVFVVVLAGLVLPPARAFLSVGVYLLLGLVGVPVFAGGNAGVGALLGPTGGYLWGFAVGAATISLIRRTLSDRSDTAAARTLGTFVAAGVGILLIYLLGWGQLMLVTGMGVGAAFAAGVLPFVGADAIKALVAVGVARTLERAGLAD